MLCRTRIALALSGVLGAGPGVAQAEPLPETGEVTLEAVTVRSSTRTARRIDQVPDTVTVVPAAAIEQAGARDIKDVFRDELDVTVRAAPTRFTDGRGGIGRAGNEGINIRGLEGNRVLMLIDGIRVPNGFAFGPFSTGRGDFLEVDGIRTAEVLRGPASTQFGSDGLAGAAIFQALGPQDLLQSGRMSGGFVRGGYASVDRSWSSTLGVAGGTGPWQGLLLGTSRQGHELANRGDNDTRDASRTSPNPVDYRSHYLLGKSILMLEPGQTLGLTFETLKHRQDTDVYSARTVPGAPADPRKPFATLDLDARDTIDRERVSLEHRFDHADASWLQQATSRIYWQDSKVNQFSAETLTMPGEIQLDSTYRTRVIGLSTQLESKLSGWVNQRLSYGVEWSRAAVSAVRDGTVVPHGEPFPSKPFPDTTSTQAGVFVQSEIEAGDFSIIPGLRFDHYRLSPSSSGYSGQTFALADRALTPRLGIVWQLAPAFSPYGQYSMGFRAPTPEQVNNGYSSPERGYASIGNADLKAERAASLELGVRGKLAGLRYSVAAFDNHYRDFIDQQVVRGAGTSASPRVFQYVNLDDVKIRGLEARTEWQFASGWTGSAGFAFSRGDSQGKGERQPLNSIQPFKAVLGLSYDEARWGARSNLVYSYRKASDRIAPDAPARPGIATPVPFAVPSYTVLDLGLYWKPMRNLTVNANLNNVFDTRYWRWSDTRGLADASSVKDAYTAPGRNAQLSVRYDF